MFYFLSKKRNLNPRLVHNYRILNELSFNINFYETSVTGNVIMFL